MESGVNYLHFKSSRRVCTMKFWRERSFLEQALLLLVVCLLTVVLGLSITVGIRNRDGWGCPVLEKKEEPLNRTKQSQECSHSTDIEHYCDTKSCIELASSLLSSTDFEVDPCDDFYHYACGRWMDNIQLGRKRKVTPASLSAEKIFSRIKEMLEEDNEDETLPHHFITTRKYYSSCVNWISRELDGVQKFLNDLSYFGLNSDLIGDQWNASFNYIPTLVRMWEKGFRTRFLISVLVRPDPRNTSKLIIALGPPDSGLSSPDLLERSEMASLYSEYLQHFVDSLCQEKGNESQCVDDEKRNEEIDQAIQVHRKFAQIQISALLLKEGESQKSFVKVGDLESLVKEVDWLTLIRLHLSDFRNVDSEEEIFLGNPYFFIERSVTVHQYSSCDKPKSGL